MAIFSRRALSNVASVLPGALLAVVSVASAATADVPLTTQAIAVQPSIESSYAGVRSTIDTYIVDSYLCGTLSATESTACFSRLEAITYRSFVLAERRLSLIHVPSIAKSRTERMTSALSALELAVKGAIPTGTTSSKADVAAAVTATSPGYLKYEIAYFSLTRTFGSSIFAATSTPAKQAALREMSAIGLQGGDVSAGSSVESGAYYLTEPSGTSPCTPLSSQPWIADSWSPDLVVGGTDFQSNTVLMPSPEFAKSTIRLISVPDYGISCYQTDLRSGLAPYLALWKSCKTFTLAAETARLLPSAAFPGRPTVYRLAATVRCAGSAPTTGYIDVVTGSVGAIITQDWFTSIGTAPKHAVEVAVYRAMVARAEAARPHL